MEAVAIELDAISAIGRIMIRRCTSCHERMNASCFREDQTECVWCQWACPRKRAKARYNDKLKADSIRRRTKPDGTLRPSRLAIGEAAFVNWYLSQPDCCHYCGLTMTAVKTLRLQRGGFGNFVSWDIDRLNSKKPYRLGNMALSCFVCNMAKGNLMTEAEAKQIGAAVRKVFRAKLQIATNAA